MGPDRMWVQFSCWTFSPHFRALGVSPRLFPGLLDPRLSGWACLSHGRRRIKQSLSTYYGPAAPLGTGNTERVSTIHGQKS